MSASPQPKLLLVEDDRENGLVLEEVLAKWGYQVTGIYSGREAVERARTESFDVVLTDIRMPGVDGIQVLKAIRQCQPITQVVMMTGFGSIESAVEAVQAGAFDYVSKPFKFDEIRLVLQRALEQRQALQTVGAQTPAQEPAPVTLIGHSRAMAEIYKLIARVAPGHSTVLILGESGTGKELVARAIHQHSDRAAGPFIALNCAALPDALLESELFGYVKGAHSTATTDKPGVFELANGGTLLLDEIGDMSLALQAKLLRALEQSEIRRLGDTRTLRSDVRLIASTNKDLGRLVHEEKFREDLYYRLNVVTIPLPPLRDRPEDIPALVDHFIRIYAARTHHRVIDAAPEVLELLQGLPWPGNVRELEHVIERAVILNTKSQITLEDIPEELRAKRYAVKDVPPAQPLRSLQEMERQHIQRVIEQTRGNIKAAAEVLGIDRKTLYRKIAEYGLAGPPDTPPT
jgi:two-component system response regulator AtoC